jgi:hypothetical protein
MTCTIRRLAGVITAAALATAACSSTTAAGPATTVATTTTVVGGATPAETVAASLRANLTALLVSHSFLTALTTSTAVSGGDPGPATAVVDTNSHALADIVGAAFGPPAGAQFYGLWAGHVGSLLAYAKAKAANDTAGLAGAKKDLDTFRTALGTFFNGVDVNLLGSAVADEFSSDIQAQLTEIDAQSTHSTMEYADLSAAAAPFPHAAEVLAAGIAKRFPSRYPGTATGAAANLRAGLTAALVSHVYLTGVTTAAILVGGNVPPAADTLATNTQALANVVASVYGDPVARQFSTLWSGHVGQFTAYAAAVKAGDSAGAAAAKSSALGFPSQFGAFAATQISGLSANALTSEFIPVVTAQLAAIDAQAAQSTTQFDQLRQAADLVGPMATRLSEGIAEQFPQRFLP